MNSARSTIEGEELRRTAELLHRYADLHSGQALSLADASVIAVAEHRGVTDFSRVHPRNVPRFVLLP